MPYPADVDQTHLPPLSDNHDRSRSREYNKPPQPDHDATVHYPQPDHDATVHYPHDTTAPLLPVIEAKDVSSEHTLPYEDEQSKIQSAELHSTTTALLAQLRSNPKSSVQHCTSFGRTSC
jgi:hypothetical protein